MGCKAFCHCTLLTFGTLEGLSSRLCTLGYWKIGIRRMSRDEGSIDGLRCI